jgi:hypothetical protein
MIKKKYTDWGKVLELDNMSFCVELKMSIEESMEFKRIIESEKGSEYDWKKLNVMNQFSSRLKDNYRNRQY